ncbi:MAG: hypothetical protein WC620_04310 [Methanoregula sp.]
MASRFDSFCNHLIFRTKPISQLMEHCQGDHALNRVLRPYELMLLGIGAVVGTGIFVITGVAAANMPARLSSCHS